MLPGPSVLLLSGCTGYMEKCFNSHSFVGCCPGPSFPPCGMRVQGVLAGSQAAGEAVCLQRGFARGCCNALLLSESLCCDFSSSSSPLLTAELGLSVMGSEVFLPYFGFTEAGGCEKEREKLWQQQMLMSLLFSRATSGS